jgi:hypothetical protein
MPGESSQWGSDSIERKFIAPLETTTVLTMVERPNHQYAPSPFYSPISELGGKAYIF